jgi:hypothetical protein
VDSLAYVGCWQSGLWIVNVEDKANPKTVGHYPLQEDAFDVFVSGDYAYVCDSHWPNGNEGLRIINVSDPANPFQVGSFVMNELGCYRVFVRDTLAYVAACNFYILNVKDPANPVQIGYSNTNGGSCGIDVQDSLAYIADGWMGANTGLRVFNISDPKNPFQIGYCYTGWAMSCDVEGSLAYMACTSPGIKVLDVADPLNPTIVGYFDTPDYAENLQFSDPYIFVADRDCGLQIYEYYGTGIEEEDQDMRQPPTLKLLQNPVTGSSIKLMLTANNPNDCALGLYNILGQEVKAFNLESLSMGKNHIDLSVEHVPNGIYFLRLNDGSNIQSEKVVILK